MLIFMDGFDTGKLRYPTNNNMAISSSVYRNGGNSLYGNMNTAYYCRYSFANNANTLVLGCAVYYQALDGNNVLLAFLDAGTYQVEVRLSSTGGLSITRNGTLLASASTTLAANVWYYLEFKAKIANSGGVAELKVNGSVVATFSGDTQNSANAYANMFELHSCYKNFFDDLYFLDSTGSTNNDYLGDKKVVTRFPNGNGATNQWTANGSASNYQCVDESPPNNDTDYVSDGTVNDVDLYSIASISGGSIYGVQLSVLADCDDAGARAIRALIRSGGTNYDNGSDYVMSESAYQDFDSIWETDPNTASAWTTTGLSAAQIGVKVIS